MLESEQKQPQTAEVTQEEQKRKKKKRIIIVVTVLLVIVAAAVIYFLTRPKGMTEGNYKQIAEEMESEVQEGYFETYMNTEWTFPDGASETTDAILGNTPNNRKPIRCEVKLADTEEVIFKTDVIPVGAEIPPFKLDKDLDAGTYEAVCETYLLNEEEDGTYSDYSNAGFSLTITVEN